MTGHARRASVHPRRRRTILHGGLITALSVALVAAGSGVTFALWNSTSGVTSAATTADLELTTTGFDSLESTFANHDLTTGGAFKITNATDTSSDRLGAYTVTFGYEGDAELAAELTVSVWPKPTASGCQASPPGDATTGSWASFPIQPASDAIAGSLVAGGSITYCVRVAGSERGKLAASDGKLEIRPSITATLAVGGWNDTATSSTTHETAWIFPAHGPDQHTWYQLKNQGTSRCVDVNGAATTADTVVIDYGCKNDDNSGDYNQHWKFSGTSNDYYDITPRNAVTLRMDVVAQSATSLAAIDIQGDTAARMSQEWQLQAQPGNVYQVVNRSSGMCLEPNDTLATANIEYAQVVCDGTAEQRYTLTGRGVETPSIPSLTCTNTPGSTQQSVVLSWDQPAFGNYTVRAQKTGSDTWTDLDTVIAQGASYQVPLPNAVDNVWSNGERSIQIVYGTQTLVSTTVWKATTGSTHSLRCSPPAPSVAGLACLNSGTNGVTFTWNDAAIGTYQFQARDSSTSSWSLLGSATDTNSITMTDSAPAGWSTGVKQLRVVVPNSTVNFAPAGTTVWKGSSGSGSSAYTYLRCSAPTVSTFVTSCSDEGNGTGNYTVTLSWAPHQAVGDYEVRVRETSGTYWTRIGTAYNGATSYTIPYSQVDDDWDNGTRQIQVRYGSTEVSTTTVMKERVWSNGYRHYLRCSPPPIPTIATSCAHQSNGDWARVSWDSVSTASSTVAVYYQGALLESLSVSHNSPSFGVSSVTLRDDDIPNGAGSGRYQVDLELISGGAVIADLGTRTFQIGGGNIYCG